MKDFVSSLVGTSYTIAKEVIRNKGLDFRLVRRDQDNYVVSDLSPSVLIDIEVDKDIVTKAIIK